MNKTKQSVFIQVSSFHCKFNCTVLILLGFVDIMSFYFQPELNGVMLSALLCVHSQKIKKDERGSSDHSVLVNIVSCSFQKGSSMNNCIFLWFFLFVFFIICL